MGGSGNGGQLIGEFACDIDTFGQFMPEGDVKRIWDMKPKRCRS